MKSILKTVLIQLLMSMLCLFICVQTWQFSFAEEIRFEPETDDSGYGITSLQYDLPISSRSVIDTHTKHFDGYYEILGPSASISDNGFIYNDQWLLGNPNTFSTDLLKASAVLADAAYGDGSTVANLLHKIEYSDVVCFDYDNAHPRTINDNDIVAVTYAHKDIEGTNTTLWCVAVRGTAANAEWISDFNLGEYDDSYHAGFKHARDIVLNELSGRFDSSRNNILWFTGHSRGAAVANMLAGYYTQVGYTVFAYTFACPSVAKNGICDTSLNNIYNINNAGDLIPILPRESWGYERFGQTIQYSFAENSMFTQNFYNMEGEYYRGAGSTRDYEGIVDAILPDEEAYSNPMSYFGVNLIGYVLGGHNDIGIAEFLNKYLVSQVPRRVFDMLCERSAITQVGNEISALRDVVQTIQGILRDEDAQNDWDGYYYLHQSIFNWIYEVTEIRIRYYADLNPALSTVYDLISAFQTIDDMIGHVVDLVGEVGNPLQAITHAHQPLSYVVFINTVFYGYRGRTDISEIAANTLLAPYPITSIGTACYEYNGSIESAFLDNVQYIGESAFRGCGSLTDTLTIPEGMTSVSADAFRDCVNLETLEIHDGIEVIESGAFRDCTGLTRVKLPISAQYAMYDDMGQEGAFAGCSEVTEIEYTIGNGTTYVPVPYDNDYYFYEYNTTLPYQAGDYDYRYGVTNRHLSRVILPAEMTELYPYMFFDCNAMTSITTDQTADGVTFDLPENIAAIPEYAFFDCGALTEIAFSDNLRQIGQYAFSGCIELTGTLTLPEALETVGQHAFDSCGGLTGTLTIPEGMTAISAYAFNYCYGLTELEIHDGVEDIGTGAFCNCTGLTRVKLPISARYAVGDDMEQDGAFAGCGAVEEIEYTIGSAETYLPVRYVNEEEKYDRALPMMAGLSLKRVILPTGMTELYPYMFDGCYEITSIRTDQTADGVRFDLPENITAIPEYAFRGCAGLTGTLTLPEGLQAIGLHAFDDCNGFTGTLTIPEEVTAISAYAFNNCYSLTGLELHDGVEGIGSGAFGDCSALTRVKLPISAQYAMYDDMGQEGAFAGCGSVEEIEYTIGDGTTYMPVVCNNAYQDYTYNTTLPYQACVTEWYGIKDRNLKRVILPAGMTTLYPHMFDDCYRMTSITTDQTANGVTFDLPENITAIPEYAFFNCSALTEIAFSDNIGQIGQYAFGGCSGLTGTLTLPEALESIGQHAFDSCGGLSGTLTIPEGVTAISAYAFNNCYGLTGLEIHDGVEVIGSGAFCDCSALTRVKLPISARYVLDDNMEQAGAFAGCSWVAEIEYTIGTGELYVPVRYEDEEEKYDKALPMEAVSGLKRVILPTGMTALYPHMFDGCSEMTSIRTDQTANGVKFDLPETLTTIPEYAFRGCAGLTGTPTLPEDLEAIGQHAFADCRGLSGTLALPETLETVGQYAFSGCSGLTGTLTIPERMTGISPYAFNDCDGLTGLEIHDGVEAIGSGAFFDCGGLTRVKLPISTRYAVGDDMDQEGAFAYCGAVAEIEYTIGSAETYIPVRYEDVEEKYDRALPMQAVTSLKRVILPTGMTALYPHMFDGCSSLTSIRTDQTVNGVTFDLPEDIAAIPEYAFNGCGELTGTLTLPEGLEAIGEHAFDSCGGLTGTLTIPEGMTAISAYTFNYCYGLTELEIHDGVEVIGSGAFSDCSGLLRVKLPISARYVVGDDMEQAGAFAGCSWVAEIEYTIGTGELYVPVRYEDEEEKYDKALPMEAVSGLKRVILPTGMTALYPHMFDGCSEMTSIRTDQTANGVAFDLPEDMTEIAEFAFRSCGFVEIALPEGVTQIDPYAFSECRNLESIELPTSLASIGDYAFSSCGEYADKLDITFAGPAPFFADRCFADTSADAHVRLGDPTWTQEIMRNYGGQIHWVHDGYTVYLSAEHIDLYLTDFGFGDAAVLTVVSEPEGLDPDQIELTSDDEYIVSVDGNRLIGLEQGTANVYVWVSGRVSASCTVTVHGDLPLIRLPNDTVRIEEEAFASIPAVQAVLLPEGITQIDACAFAQCANLRIIHIPNTVADIGEDAFEGCESVRIYCPSGSAAEQYAIEKGIDYYIEE